MRTPMIAAVSAVLLFSPLAAAAQTTAPDAGAPVTTQEDDDGFPWGLLGLLGLLGLMGMKKREHHHDTTRR